MFLFFSFQQSLEFVPADSQEVSGAGVEAGAEGGGHDGESAAQPERSREGRRGGGGVEEGGDCFIRR